MNWFRHKDVTETPALHWLDNYDGEKRAKIIADTRLAITKVIRENDLEKYNNSANNMVDVFNLIYEQVALEVAPTNETGYNELSDYFSLVSQGQDLPKIVWTYLCDMFKEIEVTDNDRKWFDDYVRKAAR